MATGLDLVPKKKKADLQPTSLFRQACSRSQQKLVQEPISRSRQQPDTAEQQSIGTETSAWKNCWAMVVPAEVVTMQPTNLNEDVVIAGKPHRLPKSALPGHFQPALAAHGVCSGPSRELEGLDQCFCATATLFDENSSAAAECQRLAWQGYLEARI